MLCDCEGNIVFQLFTLFFVLLLFCELQIWTPKLCVKKIRSYANLVSPVHSFRFINFMNGLMIKFFLMIKKRNRPWHQCLTWWFEWRWMRRQWRIGGSHFYPITNSTTSGDTRDHPEISGAARRWGRRGRRRCADGRQHDIACSHRLLEGIITDQSKSTEITKVGKDMGAAVEVGASCVPHWQKYRWNFLTLSYLSNGDPQRQCHDENSNIKLLLLQDVTPINFDLLWRCIVYTNVGKHTWRGRVH